MCRKSAVPPLKLVLFGKEELVNLEVTTIVLITGGLAYSVLLLSVSSSVAENFFLSPSAKRWLIFLMIAFPIVGLLLAKFKTRSLRTKQNINSNSDNLSASVSSYGESSDCGGGGE